MMYAMHSVWTEFEASLSGLFIWTKFCLGNLIPNATQAEC